jgi:hypothetical protein
MKKFFSFLSVLIAAAAYLYLIVLAAKTSGEGLSLTTFGLWAILAWITVGTTMQQKADPRVAVIYGIGATSTSIILIGNNRFGSNMLDGIVAVLVIICICLWLTRGPKWALVCAVAAGMTATVPFIVMTWHAPAQCPIVANTGFLVANILALIAAPKWTIQDRLYPAGNVLVTALLVIPWVIMKIA